MSQFRHHLLFTILPKILYIYIKKNKKQLEAPKNNNAALTKSYNVIIMLGFIHIPYYLIKIKQFEQHELM